MNNTLQSKFVLLVFCILVCMDWSYVLWVKYQPDIIINAWFVLIPLASYFYFTFALIAGFGLYHQKKFGIALAFGVIMYGSLSACLSYSIAFKYHFLIEMLIIPLLICNFCGILYIAYQRDNFNAD